ncbi:MAG: universal stress protein [Burkholderiales bacterium]
MTQAATTGTTFIIGYDGSDAAKRALDFSITRAKDRNGQVHVVCVLEWSPFSFLTQEELAERSKTRKSELDRAEKFLAPVLKQIADQGVAASHEVRFGHAGEVLCEIAGLRPGSTIIVGRTGGNKFTDRFLGSLAMTLVQASPVPVTVVQ